MKILMIGDIVGRPGRRIVKAKLREIQAEHGIDFVMANGENAAGGKGITREVTRELLGLGIDVITMGNHTWDNKEIHGFIDDESRLIRPANYPGDCPGRGYNIFQGPGGWRVGVVNLSGRVFLPALDCPFRCIDYILERIKEQADIIMVDFHAEATSEKQAFAWYVDGRVTAVFGTHTHVQTADECILPGGTAYITDVGMSGPQNSILGVKVDQVIQRFLTMRPVQFDVARGPAQLDAVVLELNNNTFKPMSLYRVKHFMEG